MSSPTPPTDSPADEPEGRRVPRGVRRVAILVAALTLVGLIARLSGLTDDLSVSGVRATMESAGPLGWLVYGLLFCLCYLATVPGMLFVAAAIAAYGPVQGGLLGYCCALLAVSCNFWAGRTIGGRDLSQLRWRFVQTLLARLDERPIRTIAVARFVLMLTPPFDYGLGLSDVSYPRFLVGSAVGLIPPVLAATILIDHLLRWLG